jgi:hypothetical protein
MESAYITDSTWPMRALTQADGGILATLFARSEKLTWFALLMLAAAVVTLMLLWADPRSIRDTSVWAKPIKFMIATALFALTSAWLLGLVPEAVRASKTISITSWVLIATALFEVAYISLQGARGMESHYNVRTPFYGLMFGVMALAAIALTATQAVFAWQIYRWSPVSPLPAATWAVIAGLSLTFVLGTLSGFILGGNQPPPGDSANGIAIFGWQINARDFRPAHFLGLHAHQLLPIAGIVIQRWLPARWGLAAVAICTLLYTLLWLTLIYQTTMRASAVSSLASLPSIPQQ